MSWFSDWLGSWFGASESGEGGGGGTNAQGLRTRRAPCPCCGGGTSGGGDESGIGHCCGCNRFACEGDQEANFPATLEVTVTSPCMGTRTVSLTGAIVDLSGNGGCGPTIGGRRAIYSGSYTGATNGGFIAINPCPGGIGTFLSPYVEESLSIYVACCDGAKTGPACEPGTGADASEWLATFTWSKAVGGALLDITAKMKLTITSCSPLTMTASDVVICGSFSGNIEDFPCYEASGPTLDEPVTSVDEAVGCSIQVDVNE